MAYWRGVLSSLDQRIVLCGLKIVGTDLIVCRCVIYDLRRVSSCTYSTHTQLNIQAFPLEIIEIKADIAAQFSQLPVELT